MAPGRAGEGPGTDQCGEHVRARLAEYAELWRAAGTKVAEGRYGLGDLVDDWVRWAGMAADDATAAASLVLRPRPDDPPRGEA